MLKTLGRVLAQERPCLLAEKNEISYVSLLRLQERQSH